MNQTLTQIQEEFDKWKDETMTDFVANFRYPIISPEYISMFEQFIIGHAKRLLNSHNTELVSKIEEEIVEIRKIWEQYDEYEKIINIAKIETFEKVINLINQEK